MALKSFDVENTAEVQARRSVLPQSEALRIQLEALPAETSRRFLELFTALVQAKGDERDDIRVAIEELLNPDKAIGNDLVSIENWDVRVGLESGRLERQKAEFAKRVLARMHALGLTQKELAERAGVSQSNISQIISGKYKPQPKTLSKLAMAMECQMQDLWPEDE